MDNLKNIHDSLDKREMLASWTRDAQLNKEALEFMISDNVDLSQLRGYKDFDKSGAWNLIQSRLEPSAEEDMYDFDQLRGYKEYDKAGAWSSIQSQIATSAEDEYDYTQLKGYKEYDKAKAWSSVEAKTSVNTNKSQETGAKVFSLRPLMRIAAAAIVLMGAVFVMRPYLSGDGQSAIVAQERQVITLPDGSVITLDEGAELNYNEKDFSKNRMLSFEGRAYFDVAKSEGKNFVVNANGFEVEVLGTEFEIKTIGHEHSVTVHEGKVRVEHNGKEKFLTANQKAFIKNGELQEAVVDDKNMASWRTGKLAFQNELLSDIISDLEDHFIVNIDASSTSNNLSCPWTSESKGASLESILKDLKINFGAEYTIENSNVTISNLSCAK